MQTKRSPNRPNSYLLALLLGVLSGCSASASLRAGSSSDVEGGHEHRARSSGSELHEPKAHASSAPLSRADETAVATAEPVVTAPDPQAADPARDDRGDHDRGHGNDQDGVDEDNPGKSKQAAKKKAAKAPKVTAPTTDGDHDRGHGNDQDGVDEDNPGKSKKSK